MRPAAGLAGCALFVGFGVAASGGAAPDSGIAGRIVESPTCPVERVPPEPQCAPKPIVAKLRIDRAGSRAPSEVVTSGTDGRFRVRLAPATYVVRPLRVKGSPFPRPPAPSWVLVRTDRFSYVRITYDTGIR